VLGGFTHSLNQAVFGIPLVTIDETLGGERTFVLPVNGDVNVRSARAIWYGRYRTKIIAAIAGRHKPTKTLEVAITLGPFEPTVL